MHVGAWRVKNKHGLLLYSQTTACMYAYSSPTLPQSYRTLEHGYAFPAQKSKNYTTEIRRQWESSPSPKNWLGKPCTEEQNTARETPEVSPRISRVLTGGKETWNPKCIRKRQHACTHTLHQFYLDHANDLGIPLNFVLDGFFPSFGELAAVYVIASGDTNIYFKWSQLCLNWQVDILRVYQEKRAALRVSASQEINILPWNRLCFFNNF